MNEATKERRRRSIHPDFKTHGQSHPKSEAEGTSGSTKWTSVQQKLKRKKKRIKVNLQKRPTPCPFYANVYRLMFECFLAQYRDYSPVANYCIADVVITEAGWENDFISELPP